MKLKKKYSKKNIIIKNLKIKLNQILNDEVKKKNSKQNI